MKRTKKEWICIAFTALFAVATVVVVILGVRGGTTEAASLIPAARPTVKVQPRKESTVIQVEKKITSDIIEDGLNDMGLLITGDYYFTEVVDYSSVKTLRFFKSWKVVMPGSESSYIISYDGNVDAGIDFASIRVEMDDAEKLVTIRMPQAQIHKTSIDPQSFTLYSEKSSVVNPISVTDYNNSLAELEATANDKAVQRGLLTRANENAQNVVSNFIGGLVDTDEYTLKFVTG